MKNKQCTKCKKSFPATPEYFFRYYDKLRPRCKSCETSKKIAKPKKCAVCGSEFMPVTTLSKYCSRDCKYQADLQARSKKPRFKKCNQCGNEFSPYTSLDKFCSANCRVDYQKSNRPGNKRWTDEQVKKRMGKNNPGYRNGYYTRAAKRTAVGQKAFLKNGDEIKQEMIDTLGYIYCEFCNTSESPRFERHHIVYRSEKPKHPQLHCKRNILIVCIACHNELHKVKSYRNNIVEARNLQAIFGNDVLNK